MLWKNLYKINYSHRMNSYGFTPIDGQTVKVREVWLHAHILDILQTR